MKDFEKDNKLIRIIMDEKEESLVIKNVDKCV